MVAPKTFLFSLRDVAVASKDAIWLVGESGDGQYHVIRWRGAWAGVPAPVAVSGICVLEQPVVTVLGLSPQAQVVRFLEDATITLEAVDESKDGPQHLGELSEIRAIAGRAYVVGLRRTAYRCDAPGQWARIDAGVRCAAEDLTDAGLNSIHGFSAEEIYACGWDGEIWRFDGRSWAACPPLTDHALFRVVCAPDGAVYVCGQAGAIVRGRGETWERIEHKATTKDFRGAVWFKDRLFLATNEGIYTFADGAVTKLKLKGPKPVKAGRANSFHRLDASADLIWSVGDKMALYSEDGADWTETPYELAAPEETAPPVETAAPEETAPPEQGAPPDAAATPGG